MSIADALAGGTQTQSFSYDNLDRLFTASATGGTGGLYSQSYNYYSSDGRMLNGPAGTNYDYADASHPHAVTTAGANSYAYDFNGNMITRTVGSTTYVQSYDAENRLVSVTGGTVPATFVYDGDNNRVRGTIGNVVTVYVGNLYEVRNGMVKKYYYAGNQRVAMRDSGTLYWLLGDHLGSTAYTINGTTEVAEVRHRPWGQNRFVFGTTPTTYRFTGQREESSIGLYYYGARWYDPALGRLSGVHWARIPLCRISGMHKNNKTGVAPAGTTPVSCSIIPCLRGSFGQSCQKLFPGRGIERRVDKGAVVAPWVRRLLLSCFWLVTTLAPG